MLTFMCGASALGVSSPAYAQTETPAPADQTVAVQPQTDEPAPAPAPAEAATAPAPATAVQGENIVVTGSRVVRDGYTQPTPVTVARTEDLALSTPSSIPDALNRLPQLLGSSGAGRSSPNFASTSNQGNILNLRGIGGLRTLILFDGIRVPPTTYLGAVDVNVLPQMLVERVDIVTGGASAAYGSDAVSGVVNFVLNRDFDGINAVAQYGIATEGQGDNYRLGLAGGTPFAGGRGHLLFSAEYFDRQEIRRSDRPLLAGDGPGLPLYIGRTPGGGVAGSAGNPLILSPDNVTSNFSNFGGLITSGPAGLAGLRFNPNGTTAPFFAGTPTGTPGTFLGGEGFYIPDENTTLSPKQRNIQLYGRASYELSDTITAFVQGNWSNSRTTYFSQGPGYTGGGNSPTRIFQGNPFLPANVSAILDAASTPGNPASFVMNKNLYYLDPFENNDDTTSWMAMAGVEGSLGGGLRWDASYVRGESVTEQSVSGVFDIPRLSAALDAVRDGAGNIVCRVTLTNPGRFPGCVPMNPFGVGSESRASLDYTLAQTSFRAATVSDNIMANLRGPLFALPAGNVNFAVGAEYRRVSFNLDSTADPSTRVDYSGLRAITSGLRYNNTNVGEAEGSVEVKEAYGEISIPILRDTPFFRQLELNGAVRVTDYSTSGAVTTWKVGSTWMPVEGLTFRATRSRDIRAPALFDLFAGPQGNTGSVIDPRTNVNGPVAQVQVGNPNLAPEVADTLSIGAVIQPSFIPGFSISIDYFNLQIEGAIGTQTPLRILQDCEATNGTGDICADITRPFPFANQTPGNFPSQIILRPRNLSFLSTRGIDFDASYRRSLGAGNLALRLYATYTDSYRTQQTAALPPIEFAGRAENGFGRPKWRGSLSATYNQGPLTLFVQETMFGAMRLGPTQIYANPKLDPVFYTDATVSYRLPAFNGNMDVFLTANNLFDRRPPLIPSTTVPGINYPTLFQLYDTIGRQLTFGVRFRM